MFLNGVDQVNYGLTQSATGSLNTNINLVVSQLCTDQDQATMAFSYFRDESSNSINPKMYNDKLCEPFNIDHIISKIEDSENAKLSRAESHIDSLYKYVDKFSNYIETKYKLSSNCILSGLSTFCNYWLQEDVHNKIDKYNTNEENKSLDTQTTTEESKLDIQALYNSINRIDKLILNDSGAFIKLDKNVFELLMSDPKKCSVLLNSSNEEELYNNIKEIIPILNKYKDDENAVKLASKIMVDSCFSVKDGEIDLLSNISISPDQSSKDKLKKALFNSDNAHFEQSCKSFSNTVYPYYQAIENLSYYNTIPFKKLVNDLAKLNVKDLTDFHIREFYYKGCIDCEDAKNIEINNLITQENTESCVEYLKAYNTFSDSTLSDILQHTATIIGTSNFSDGCTIKLNIPKKLYYNCKELLKSIPKTSSTPIDTTAFLVDTSVTDTSGNDATTTTESIKITSIISSIESGNVDSTTPKLSNSTASIFDNNTSFNDNYNTTTNLSSIAGGKSSLMSMAISAGLALGAVALLGVLVCCFSYASPSCSSSSAKSYDLLRDVEQPHTQNHVITELINKTEYEAQKTQSPYFMRNQDDSTSITIDDEVNELSYPHNESQNFFPSFTGDTKNLEDQKPYFMKNQDDSTSITIDDEVNELPYPHNESQNFFPSFTGDTENLESDVESAGSLSSFTKQEVDWHALSNINSIIPGSLGVELQPLLPEDLNYYDYGNSTPESSL